MKTDTSKNISRAYYLQVLRNELQRRCERNPRYSVRSFAKALGIDAGALSRILAGKRVPSLKIAQKLFRTLDLSIEEQHRFLASLAQVQRSRELTRLSPSFRKMPAPAASQPRDLSIEMFRVIADWYHYAILELTFLEDFNPDTRSIAARLGISPAEARLAIDRLLELGLIHEENGTYVKTQAVITTADKHLTTPALRRHQKQILEKALHSLENDSIERRSMTSMTMSIDPDKLPIAKQMIEEFTQRLCGFLESERRREVYELGIALFPAEVQKTKSKNESPKNGSNEEKGDQS